MTTIAYRELLIGCGHSREKRIVPNVNRRSWTELYTLDNNTACEPDYICDLARMTMGPSAGERFFRVTPNAPIADLERLITPIGERVSGDMFHSNTFDEIHAYEVLEHIGAQGDFVQFFAQFRELWRILKPSGFLCATVPDYRSIWAFGDPGHTRVISAASLVFLSQRQYKNQLGKTAMSDYYYLLAPADFEILNCRTEGEQMRFVLRAIK